MTNYQKSYSLYLNHNNCSYTVPDLPVCLCVLKHRAPLARWRRGRGIFLPKNAVYRNRNRNRNKFINQIRAPGGHIQLTIMIDTQQYIKLNIHSEVSIIVVQAHSGRKRDICTYTYTHILTYIYVYVPVCMYMHVYIHIYIYIHIHTYIHTHTYIGKHTQNIHMLMHTHTHIYK